MLSEKEVLKDVGLSEKEAEVYLILLKLGSATAGEISQKSRTSRPHIYDALKKLMYRGFTSYVIKDNKKYFKATQPDKILDIIKEKERYVIDILPSLKKLASPKRGLSVEVYEDKEGLKNVLEDVVNMGKDWLVISSTGKSSRVLPHFIDPFERKRVKLGIRMKILYNRTTEAEEKAKHIKSFGLTQIRPMPEKYSSPATVYIYGHKIAIVMWSYDKPVAIVIENEEISQSFGNYFKWLWKTAKHVE